MPGGRGRGGKRAGKTGTAYANRSDLNGPKAISAAPGQAYGERGAQEAAQRAVPMGTPALPPAAPGVPEGLPKAGGIASLFADSTNPDEHVMSGAAAGPGPGPEAFGFGEQARDQRDIDWARRYLPAMQFAANNGPKATDASRQIIRLLRARIEGS